MSFYSRMQNTSNRLLIGKGQTVTLTHVVPGTYDPATGLITNTTTTQTGFGAILDWDARHIDGTLIKIGDKQLLLSPLNTAGAELTAPVLGDTVTDAAGVVYMIVAPLKTLSPAGTAVLYDCNLSGLTLASTATADIRITESGHIRVTEAGDSRVIE